MENETNKNQPENNIPNNINYINCYQSSESIVKLILDKIINIALNLSNINQINNDLNDFYFEFLKNQIEPLLEEKYMNYTRLKSKYNPNAIFWKNKNIMVDELVEIEEPEPVIKDRFEGGFAHIKEIVKNKKLKISKRFESNNKEKTAQPQKEIEKNEKIDKNKQKSSIIQNIDNKTDANKKKSTSNKKEVKSKNKSPIQDKSNAKKKIQMIEFPSEDIPNIEKECNFDVYDPPQITQLRKEKEIEIIKKEEEIKLQIKLAKMAKRKEELDKIKSTQKVKALDPKKFTFDSNGTIIQFKRYKLDSLPKDFAFVKNGIKKDAIKSNKKKNKSKEPNAKLNSNEEVIKNPKDEDKGDKSFLQMRIQNERNKEKIIPSGSNFKIFLPNIGVVIKEKQNIKEGGREFNKYFNKYSLSDYDKILNEYVPLQNKNKSKVFNKLERLNLTPTNVQKKISESIDNFRNKKNFGSMNSFDNSSYNKTVNYNQTITENITNNPLLNNTDNISININDIDNTSSAFLKTSGNINSFNRNNYTPLMTTSFLRTNTKEKSSINFSNTIMMKKEGISSLKMEIESMKDLKTDRAFYGIEKVKPQNIFGRDFMKNYKIGLFKKSTNNNSLATLNRNILTDENWGNRIGGTKDDAHDNIIFAKHHTKQQVVRELGSNIFNRTKIKLPRDRKVEIRNIII
jgi:hypothetical protein